MSPFFVQSTCDCILHYIKVAINTFLYLQILFLNVYSYYQDIKVRITLKGDKMAYINEINTDDLNYFRNRIINRMRELNINSTRALAEK